MNKAGRETVATAGTSSRKRRKKRKKAGAQGTSKKSLQKKRGEKKKIFEVDIVHHLRRSHHAVSGCSLGELGDACLRGANAAEGLAALWCECQLLLGCTSQALAPWLMRAAVVSERCDFSSGCKESLINQPWKTWPAVKHMKASFVSSRINGIGPDILGGLKSSRALSHPSRQLSPTFASSQCISMDAFHFTSPSHCAWNHSFTTPHLPTAHCSLSWRHNKLKHFRSPHGSLWQCCSWCRCLSTTKTCPVPF